MKADICTCSKLIGANICLPWQNRKGLSVVDVKQVAKIQITVVKLSAFLHLHLDFQPSNYLYVCLSISLSKLTTRNMLLAEEECKYVYCYEKLHRKLPDRDKERQFNDFEHTYFVLLLVWMSERTWKWLLLWSYNSKIAITRRLDEAPAAYTQKLPQKLRIYL